MLPYLARLVGSVARRGGERARRTARTAGLLALAGMFGSVALGFATAGAFMILRTLYDPVVALFIVGGVYAAIAILLVLYVVLGGHETAREAHAAPDELDTAQSTLAGLAESGRAERDRLAMLAGTQLARSLKPTHLLALSFVAGLLASRGGKSERD